MGGGVWVEGYGWLRELAPRGVRSLVCAHENRITHVAVTHVVMR